MAILLRHPSPDRLRQADLTYPDVGATAGELPDGYAHVERRVVVGHGRKAFDCCADGLLTWQVHQGAGLDVRATRTPPEVGTVVSQRLGWHGVGVVAPCRVISVVDERTRRGFAYGTLPGHPEAGEEFFVVQLEPAGDVVLEIRAFSRPASALLALAGRVSRRIQARVLDRYVEAARALAAGGSTVPDDVVSERAELLPEERAAGPSADPRAQAAAILAESEERVNAPHDPPDGPDRG